MLNSTALRMGRRAADTRAATAAAADESRRERRVSETIRGFYILRRRGSRRRGKTLGPTSCPESSVDSRSGVTACYRKLILRGSGSAVDDYDIERGFAAFETQAELFAQGGLP